MRLETAAGMLDIISLKRQSGNIYTGTAFVGTDEKYIKRGTTRKFSE
jgi:hypothetical protein